MFVLDTNIVSALMQPEHNRAASAWFAHHDAADMYLTTIVLAEIQVGIHLLPLGKRRVDLERRLRLFLARGFKRRILPFTWRDAMVFANLSASRRHQGLHVDDFDMLIAAVARNQKAAIVTRNQRDFQACDLEIINPFDFTA